MLTKLFGLFTKLLIISPLVLVLPHYALAELYECRDKEGTVSHHSRVPCPEGYSSKLIQDKGSLNTASKAYSSQNVSPKHENVEVISRGRLIDLIDYIDYGKYTVFMFYADWCAPCKTVKPELEKSARSQNTFALKELNVLNWENPLVTYYNLAGLPYFIVYGPEGEFVERGPVLSKELKKKIIGTN
jgi:thiol-disulfide isomerase/thioredoxin